MYKQIRLLSSSYRFFLLRRPIHPKPARPWVQPPQVNSVTPRNARYGRYAAGLPHIYGTGLLGQAHLSNDNAFLDDDVTAGRRYAAI
jgi:hypothetical protein